MYFSKLQNVFVQIAKYICQNCKMYFSKVRLRGWFSVDRGGLIGVSLAKSQVASHLKPNSIPSQKHTEDQTRPYQRQRDCIALASPYYIKTTSPGKTSDICIRRDSFTQNNVSRENIKQPKQNILFRLKFEKVELLLV